MRNLVLASLLFACGGQPFTERPINETRINQASIGGHSGEVASAGAKSAQGVSGNPNSEAAGNSGGSGAQQGGMGGVLSGASPGGDSPMAGGPAMAGGGTGGNGPVLSVCLAFFQNLDCARVCTNSQSDCQAVLSCMVSSGSIDNCTAYTTIGISLAQSAERDCCK